MVAPNIFLVLVLIVLIVLAILLAVSIFRGRKIIRGNQSEEAFNNDTGDNHFILFFKQFSATDIDNFYDFLTPGKEITKETETLLGEGKLGSKIFPVEVGSSITQTIERQIKAPTPLFKYEYIIRRLKQDNKLTIIESGITDDTELTRFEHLLEELKQYSIELPPETIKTTKANIKNRKTVDKLLRERIVRYTKLNCLILNFPFVVKKEEYGYELISARDELRETTVSVKLGSKSLTPRGEEYFQTSSGQKLYFSVFGEAEISEANEEEYILITSFAVF
jgi:hypothetical protein